MADRPPLDGPASAAAARAAEALPAEVTARVDELVRAFVDDVAGADPESDTYRGRIADIDAIGAREVLATSAMAGRMAGRPGETRELVGPGSPLARTLADLRRTVAELDPARYDLFADGPRRVLGVIPAGSRIDAYLDRFARAQDEIRALVEALGEGRSRLQLDNAVIHQDRRSLAMEIDALRGYAFMTERLDAALGSRIASLAPADPDRARALELDVLYPVRRRRQDLLTQLAVVIQGDAALRLVEHGNDDLMRAVQVAVTTTVAALQTAVSVVGAIAHRQAAGDQAGLATGVALDLADQASALARDPAVAASPAVADIDLATLERSWRAAGAALADVDVRRLGALRAIPGYADDATAGR